MFYCIERVLETEIPFDNAFTSINIGKRVYDIVKGPKNTGLDSVSDFIIDENNTVIKADPSIQSIFVEEFQEELSLKLNELLLG